MSAEKKAEYIECLASATGKPVVEVEREVDAYVTLWQVSQELQE